MIVVDRVWFWPVLILAGWLLLVSIVHSAASWWWQRTLVAYRLDTPARTSPVEVAAWVGALRSLLRPTRAGGLVPGWPIGVEITGTHSGIERVVVVPRRWWPDVQAAVTATLPGTRVTELPGYPRARFARCRLAGEARNRAGGNMLATQRAQEASRYLLAALQPLGPGEMVRVQWLLSGARAPRAAFRTTPPADVRRALGPRWSGTDPVLHGVCRVGVAAGSWRRRRNLFRRAWSALRGLNTPGAVVRRRWWLPSLLVAHRLRRRRTPWWRWPLTVTNREVAGLLGLTTGASGLPGLPAGVTRSLPPPVRLPRTGVVLGESTYPGTRTLLRLRAEDRLRHVWAVGPTGVGKSTLLGNMIIPGARG
ncbi:hypothetical protein EV193_11636 [Herbihabitans rhizosphaerae]|uniref:FtsK/SpoIIIE family protein n=1 Tax=Herbihabitans rhizosphaerae TaxID=1872711 RepID=A0A4Q7KCV2_9PSEU|nr:hypothetical protein [Herbihabitans rhizosphaerae]RZS30516.1 hypothetical protein EV193_11636 [Herbihabitans rhizosphaerae]